MSRLGRAGRAIAVYGGTALALLAGLFVVAWLTGRITSDRFQWSQWLLWIPTLSAVGAAAIGLIAALRPAKRPSRRRRRLLTWGVVVAALLVYLTAIEHKLWRPTGRDADGLRVVHWTITESRSYHKGGELADELRRLDGDLTILTNVGGAAVSREVRAWLGAGLKPDRIGPFTVLTRDRIQALRWIVKAEGASIVYLELAPPPGFTAPLRALLVDMPSNPRRPRMALARQLRTMLDDADAPEVDMIVGDCNMTRGSAALRTLFPGFRDAFVNGAAGWIATFPRERPIFHIDHVLLGPKLRSTAYECAPTSFGRHRAQVAHVRGADG